ncbi:hypothetical protein NJC40_03735 [Pseudomonas sp. 21LCFQ02]|uniref:hypothetical protein n=1 Tax=Pseudomonas sp. 21LCFQ02 TaxID=2957505 RepID=UPI00209B55B4|nr:hypothetical protein [Pseudomonas sp. 21LCFQ02]MCO8166890.1 hypothetical protein [Pseudomonas sp. 21LCFQ02]
MCKVLEREGRQWALDSIGQLRELAGKNDKHRQLIAYLERGLRGKPASFARGVQGVIDDVRAIGERAA